MTKERLRKGIHIYIDMSVRNVRDDSKKVLKYNKHFILERTKGKKGERE